MVNPAAIPVLFIGGGVVLVGGIIYLAVRAEKKRNAAMQVVAKRVR